MKGQTVQQNLEMEHQISHHIWILKLKGEITRTTSSKIMEFDERTNDLIKGAKALLLDFSAIHAIDSSGLIAITRLAYSKSKQGYPIGVCGLSDDYRKLFHLVGLTDFLALYNNYWDALQEMKQS